jgi:peroxiredoxin-like protein
MHPYPHLYRVDASAVPAGTVKVASAGLPDLETAPPVEFDGPGNVWSPETLLCAAMADCFILTFRAVARASKFEWSKLDCQVEGTLDRAQGVAQFTKFTVHATLAVVGNVDEAKARVLLEKAEHACLISNSLKSERVLQISLLELAQP